MWWLLLLAGNEVGALDARSAPPPATSAIHVTAGSPRLLDARYDLRSARRGDRDYRLDDIDPDVAPRRSGHPLAVTAIDNDRQRLVIGVKPGRGKNKLGVAYRLRFGR